MHVLVSYFITLLIVYLVVVYVYCESYSPDFVGKTQQHVSHVGRCWSC